MTEIFFQPTSVAVCVPVRNEAALLPRLLDALARQVVPMGLDVSCCFLLDHCHDRSAVIVADFAERGPWAVHIATLADASLAANAGRARRYAVALGQSVLANPVGGVLMTTDADSEPALDWIAACCRGLATSDVVVGRIIRDGGLAIPMQDRLEDYYDRLHRLRRRCDPVSWECSQGHHSVGGANLAFRATAYRSLGGFAETATGEDSAIIDAAHRMGLRVRRDRSAIVTTSARRHGRALDGMADHLRKLEQAPNLPMVAHPEDAVWQYRGHAAARRCHARLPDASEAAALAVLLQTDVAHIERVAAQVPNAEAFATHVVPAAPQSGRQVLLNVAESVLARLEAEAAPATGSTAGYECAA